MALRSCTDLLHAVHRAADHHTQPARQVLWLRAAPAHGAEVARLPLLGFYAAPTS